jgi:Rrf2 family transcriptional regulator, iron-sulfur cluster assembly transcription factor
MMLDMALFYNTGPVRLGSIAERQGIAVKYLEQIIIPLKKAEYVKSVRGPKGGHMLAKSPDQITVAEVVNLLEGGIKLTKCAYNPEICERSEICVTRFIWKEAADAVKERLDAITFSDLLKRVTSVESIGNCTGK